MTHQNLTVFVLGLALLATGSSIVGAADAPVETSSLDSAICHVCRVHDGETEPEAVVATADYDGRMYGFCSVTCKERFVGEPTAYLPPVLPRPAPPFEALDLEGAPFSSEALSGRWTLLDFWATWCKKCVAHLPELTALHDRYSERGFAVVSISIDEGKRAAKKVSRMLARRKATHPAYLDSESAPAWAAYNVRAVPAQFLISPEGQIVAQWSGSLDFEQLEAEIAQFLDGP
ncbi:MAG: redoxin domain-containing protein [Holophagales bacterium]|nr:redoxin domain-containing protein [Holophagales bacterium]